MDQLQGLLLIEQDVIRFSSLIPSSLISFSILVNLIDPGINTLPLSGRFGCPIFLMSIRFKSWYSLDL